MKAKKIISLALSMLMVGVLATGCGSSKEEAVTKDGKQKIRFSTWDSAKDLEKQQQLVDKFNASQDEIEVVLESYGNDYDTKITASMGSGDAPDVMYMWNYPVYSGKLEPIDSYIEKEGEGYKDNFYETLWPYHSKDGTTFGLPVGFVTSSLYYNKDIFDKAGLEYPTSDWTWNDVIEASEIITEKVDGVKGFGFPIKTLPYTYEMYLWSNGTAYVDKDGNFDGNLNSKEAIEVFDMFQKMNTDGIAAALEKGVTEDMLGGKVAMSVNGTWPITNYNEAGLNYGIVEIPSFEGKHDSVSVLNTAGVAMSKDSKNKEAAWEFMKFWTGEEANRDRIGYELPSLKSVVESEKIMEDETYKPFYVMLEQSKGYTPTSFIVDGWSEIDEALGLSFERIFNPSSLEKPSDVLNEVAKQW